MERHSPDSFGEKVLGSTCAGGSKGGDWRVPAGALLKYCCLDEEPEPETEADVETERAVREARPPEIEGFLSELGLNPTPSISIK